MVFDKAFFSLVLLPRVMRSLVQIGHLLEVEISTIVSWIQCESASVIRNKNIHAQITKMNFF
jgi:hypothetical protein